ncbi:MAG: hypothetical protein QME78_00115 [Thermodesulfobacteriota bacterium]|nr:hypothetical protein [Thermodesulfobacteriota bacterium]
MPNDFSSTPSCKALWRFESGALPADSKGTNTLTAVNTPTEDTTIKKEGGCAAVLASASKQFFKITDAAMDAGFPMKTGDTTKQISICGWVRLTGLGVSGLIGKAKVTADQYCIGFALSSAGNLLIQWGTDGLIDTSFGFNQTRWYHVALVADCLNKLLYVRWYDDTTGIVYSFSPPPGRITTEVTPGSLEFRIGAKTDSDTTQTFNGRVDEVVVFAGLLGPEEIDKIRAATFASITDEAIVLALNAQALYLGDTQANVYGLHAQVLYDNIPRYTGGLTVAATPNSTYFRDPIFYTGDLTVALTPNSGYVECWAYTGDTTVSLTPTSEAICTRFYNGDVPVSITPLSLFTYDGPSVKSYDGNIGISATPNSNSWWDKAFVGGITVSLSPACETIWGRTYVGGLIVSPAPESTYFEYPPIEYTGHLTLAISPISTYYKYQLPTALGSIKVALTPTSKWMVPIIGRDNNTGYGLIDLTALQEDPPFYCAVAPILMHLDPTAASVEPYRELNILGDGGVVLGGAGVIAFEAPNQLNVVGDGGIEVAVAGVIAFLKPKSHASVGSGGVRVAGAGVIEFVAPGADEGLAYEVVGSGGVEVAGAGTVQATRPKIYALAATGGLKIGGFQVPEVVITRPTTTDLAPSAGPVVLEVSGAGALTISRPETYEVPEALVVLELGGAGGITFIKPTALVLIAEGGVIVEAAEEVAEDYETWVLTGTAMEPSVFSGFHFNSYVEYQGRYYAAASDGIYILEGEDDAGRPIHTGARIGPHNFGTDKDKRLRTIRLGNCGDQAQVRVEAGDGVGYYEADRGRVAVGRSLQDREITVDIADFDRLAQVEITPLVMVKR